MVSIIIPVYNAKSYICEAVASALTQETDKELIVLDDGSTDASMDVLERWLEGHADLVADTKVIVQKNQKNAGVAQTRNKGVRLASGEYIAFLDADDRFANGKLQKQIAKLKETGADLCNTARRLIRADGTETETVIHTPEVITLSQLEHSNRINCSSVLVRRETALRFPMAHSDAHEDYLTWLYMLQNGVTMVGIDEPLLEYRLSESGKSRNKWKSAKMTYHTYRYAGYSRMKSVRLLVCYMINGVKKYIAH